ncbi:MAG: MogA/MoaB family molybdenum cofactor biosynthesis protein [Novibacillus thermophilus]
MSHVWRVGVVTVSDRCAKGERKDEAGPLLKERVKRMDGEVSAYTVVPDEVDAIERTLITLADAEQCDLVITTGGTGFALRDVTPEATKRVIRRNVPGIPEMMRMETRKKTIMSALSRSVAGIRGRTLIVNFPGNPQAIEECFDVIEPLLPHALHLLRQNVDHDVSENATRADG